MKCEVWNCHEETDTFLCKKHEELAQNKDTGFVICEQCAAIVDLLVPGEVRHIAEDKVSKVTGQYIYLKNCNYCEVKK